MIGAFLSYHSSHNMFSLTLLVIDFFLENSSIWIKLVLETFDKLKLSRIPFLKIH